MDNFAHFSLSSAAEGNMLPLHGSPSLSPAASPAINGRITGPIRRGSITTSRNGNNARLLGPFFCRWEDCMLCDHAFPTGDAIWRHIETEHLSSRLQAVGSAEPNAGGLTCRWIGCDEVRPSLFRLKSHMRKHLDWRPFNCNHCDERFKHRGDQKKHLARKHPDVTPLRPRSSRATAASRNKEERERRLCASEEEFSSMMPPPPSQPCDTMPEYPFTHSAPPTFPGPIAPPPALSDYAFTAVSAASPMSAPLVQNSLNDHRNSLMSMMEVAGHFAMSSDFSSISQQPAHGYQQLVNHPESLAFHYHNLNDTPVSAPVACPTDPMAHILVNPQGSSNHKSESPAIQHHQPSSLPSSLATNGSASFSELVQVDNSFDNASNWLPWLEGKPATSDSDDSDAISVRSLGSTVSAHSFDHPNLPSPIMYGKCDPAYSPLAYVNFPIMSGSARKMANMLHPITTAVTTPSALPSLSNNNNAATTSTGFNPAITQL